MGCVLIPNQSAIQSTDLLLSSFVTQSTSQSISQFSQSFERFRAFEPRDDHQSLHYIVSQSMSASIRQSINVLLLIGLRIERQSFCYLVSQSLNQPVNQSINLLFHLASHILSFCLSVNSQTVNQSAIPFTAYAVCLAQKILSRC